MKEESQMSTEAIYILDNLIIPDMRGEKVVLLCEGKEVRDFLKIYREIEHKYGHGIGHVGDIETYDSGLSKQYFRVCPWGYGERFDLKKGSLQWYSRRGFRVVRFSDIMVGTDEHILESDQGIIELL